LEAPKPLPKPKEDNKKKEEKKPKKDDPKKPKEKKEEALPSTKINLEDFKRFIINSKDKKADLDKFFKEEFERENWSIWHLKYDIYKNEGTKLHVTGNLCSGFLERAEACRKGAFGIHCVIGDEPKLEIEGVWMWRGQDVMPEMKDHPTFEYYHSRKLDLDKAEDVQLIKDFWCNDIGDKMNGMVCQRRGHI
jgi:elongation factor 1-gamma